MFLATGDLANKTLTLYDGVWWGFETVPEPASLVLLALGMLATLRQKQLRRA